SFLVLLFLFCGWLLVQRPAFAQEQNGENGRIVGRIIDANTAQPLSGVQVYLTGSGQGTLTDMNGRYLILRVPQGTHDLVAEMLGFSKKTVTGVVVDEGATVSLDISLEAQAIEVDGLTVSAEREQGSTAFLLDRRASSVSMMDAVGSLEISRSPASDAAEVAKRMTGVTVADGKYVFVRGLGGRYSQTALNGSPLPSPEPEKEVVPLDLFPAGFMESLTTQKSYTPDQPADFSGGSVQIKTKDFPDRFSVKLGMSTSFNSQSQFQEGFIRYGGGGMDWLGFDDGTRDLPSEAAALLGDVKDGGRLPADPADRIIVGEALQASELSFAPGSRTTPWNRSFDGSVGGRFDAFTDGEMGFFVAGTYSDSYRQMVDEVERKWRTSAFQPETAELATPNVDYTFQRGTRTVSWGTITNFTLKPNPNHKVSLRATLNLNTDDEGRTYSGENGEDIGGILRSERSRFVQRFMSWGQLSGEHLLFWNSRLDWRATAARADRSEPNLRETIYVQDNDGTYKLLDFTESGRYFWSELTDDDLSTELDWRLPFRIGSGEGAVKVGGAFRKRSRDFGARRLNWQFSGNTIEDLDTELSAGTVVSSGPGVGEFAIDEVVEPGDIYAADDERVAGYAMVELPVTSRLQAILGARVETYSLGLDSRTRFGTDSTVASVDQTDIAPALNLVYSIRTDLKIRGAVSKTLDRPEFRELAPFQFTEATSLRQLKGNPDLVSAEILGGDLRVDWFPGLGELISIGGFYKDMTSPIEQVFIAAASSAYSFQNAESATVFGAELDVQLSAGRLSETLQNFSFQGNVAWIQSDVKVSKGGIYQPTNLSRPLEGQAPYVLNLGLNYNTWNGWEAGVFYNRFGKRLSAAGGSGLPDIYEQPRNALDATLSIPLRDGARVRLKATNLLDAEYRFDQSENGITRVQRLYGVGRTFSLGLSWEL
ncbi:MAG: carboxypeptidase-like regulatory domain-containing protein, partial [Longimicrobiales bacterium]